MNPAALPEKLRTWRRYRIEYGGWNEDCIKEQIIYLPPTADPEEIEALFEKWQEQPADSVKPQCPNCQGSGFANGEICRCITGKQTGSVVDEIKDLFGDIFTGKRR